MTHILGEAGRPGERGGGGVIPTPSSGISTREEKFDPTLSKLLAIGSGVTARRSGPTMSRGAVGIGEGGVGGLLENSAMRRVNNGAGIASEGDSTIARSNSQVYQRCRNSMRTMDKLRIDILFTSAFSAMRARCLNLS